MRAGKRPHSLEPPRLVGGPTLLEQQRAARRPHRPRCFASSLVTGAAPSHAAKKLLAQVLLITAAVSSRHRRRDTLGFPPSGLTSMSNEGSATMLSGWYWSLVTPCFRYCIVLLQTFRRRDPRPEGLLRISHNSKSEAYFRCSAFLIRRTAPERALSTLVS